MTIDYFKDAPEWADTVFFSEQKNAYVYAFSKLDAKLLDGKDNIIKLYSWPAFDHPRHGAGKFNIVAQRERDFSVVPNGIDKDLYDSICVAKATSLMTPMVIGGEWTNYGTIAPTINPSLEQAK